MENTTDVDPAPVERLGRHVLANVASGVAKMTDAPMSAQTHFDAAINELAKATEWRPDDAELLAIIDDAIEHMRCYGK